MAKSNWTLSFLITLMATGACAKASSSAPVAPSALSASNVSSSQINLKWQDNSSNEQGFLIQRSLSSSSGFVSIASVGSAVISYSNSSLSPATTYYYRVAAYRKFRGQTIYSSFSNIASASTISSSTTTTSTTIASTTTTTLAPTTTTLAPTTTTTLAPTTTTTSTSTTTTLPTAAILPTPTNIANGSTVSLQCGTIYQGTLNLAGKSNITVTTTGTCGKAIITPGQPVSGWTLEQGGIYSAPISFTPTQISVAGQPMELAHWPNKPQTWAAAGSTIPNSDLTGATLVYIDNLWTIRTQTLTSDSASTAKTFYVEGKLWMLDTPGEWAVANNRIYLWPADGQSPEGRVWASKDSNGLASNASSNPISDLASLGINANNSSGITISGIKVLSASDGISGAYSSNLHIFNSEILNSSRDGIYASSASGFVVDSTTIKNANRNGIGGWYSNNGARVTHNTVLNAGMVGMPKNSQSGIFFGNNATNSFIDGNQVSNCSYNGISAAVGSTISNNVIDSTNLALSDGGGIYTNGRTAGYVPLNMKIQGNTLTNIRARGTHAIYLDDSSSYVTVVGNSISNSASGLFIHDGSNNQVTSNTFTSNLYNHIQLANSSAANSFSSNTMNSTNNELSYQLDGSNTQSASYATYDYDTYKSSNPSRFASANGVYYSYSAWKSYTGQDVHSTMNGLP